MKQKIALILLLATLTALPARSQLSASLNGYVSNMQSVMFENLDGQWVSDNLLHNRLNFKGYLGSNLNLTIELRNRVLYGETVKYFPGYDELISIDRGWVDLSFNLVADSSYIINTSVDRIFADITIGKLQATIGRQRINWGMNFVWNPNDIFNSYSFFDFDYVERPGSDAIRIQYYLNATASLEMVSKINQAEEWSLAGLLRFNLAGTDFQFLGGVLNEEEYVVGGGFSGNLGPVSINGELTYLDPMDELSANESVILAGLGLSYNTPFNLFIQAEYLYNEAAEQTSISSFTDFYYRNLTLRDLSLSPHTFFANLSYPLNPLLNIGVSGMYFPELNGLFMGPSCDMSLRNDIDLSFFLQYFEIDFSGNQEQKATLGFMRLKWSF